MSKDIHIDSLSNKQIEKKIKERNQCTWLPLYHISPPFGLLNDPNGLSYINGKYNIYFQWYPGGPTHGLKHWFKLMTSDLINYQIGGVAMKPSKVDKEGVFSGSYLRVDDTNKIVYTGVSKENGKIIQRQNIATLENGEINKKKLLIDNTDYVWDQFRDPSWFRQDGLDYIIVGAQTNDMQPVIAVYHYKNGEALFIGNINIDLGKAYSMIECPQIVEADNKYILILSPQGLEREGINYQNTFNVLYTVFDKVDLQRMELKGACSFKEFDFGHDFYAPQIFENAKNLLLFGWAGCGKSKYPEQNDGWMNVLSMPREISLKDSQLLQKPDMSVRSLVQQYTTIQRNKEFIAASKSFTIKSHIDTGFSIKLGDSNGSISLFEKDGYLILDRSRESPPITSLHGDIRCVKLETTDFEMFVDNLIIELFINNGKNTMTSRVYCSSINKVISTVQLELAEMKSYKLNYSISNFEKENTY